MSDAEQADGAKRFRSPPYPAIPLDKAILRGKELYAKALHHPVGVQVLADAWGYGEKSSGLWAAAAALLQFGLLKSEGSGSKRKFQFTDSALRIIRDPDPKSEKRLEAIKKAALAPKIHQELWTRYGTAQTLSEVVLKSYLTVERHELGQAPYSDAAADEVIRAYKGTIAFAGLTESDSISEPSEEMDLKNEVDPTFADGHEEARMDPTPRDLTPPKGGSDVNVLLQGNRLKISATVDAEGIARLKQVLDKYEEILKLLQ